MYRLPPKRDKNMTFRASKETMDRLAKLAKAHGMSQSDCLDYWVGVAAKSPGSIRIAKEHPERPHQLCVWTSEGTAKNLKALAERKGASQGDLVEFFVDQAWKEGKGRK